MSKYERLTARRPKSGLAYLVNVKQDEQIVESPYPDTLRCIMESFERLAQYEDIGSPEEFAELARAKAEGRLVILPCRVGDTVHLDFEHCLQFRFCGWTARQREEFKNSIMQDTISNINASIFQNSVSYIVHTEKWNLSFNVSNIGKTVFLTREEAEAALKEEQA